MKGISFEDLYDDLLHGHEIEFTYDNNVYTIQPGEIKENILFSVWKTNTADNKTAGCICEYFGNEHTELTKDVIKDFLNTECYGGKSFFEIESDITVNVVF